MKDGDIVYFKEEYKARYNKIYIFETGVPYLVKRSTAFLSYFIENMIDGSNHYAHSKIQSLLISKQEFRKNRLNDILS